MVVMVKTGRSGRIKGTRRTRRQNQITCSRLLPPEASFDVDLLEQ
jgi:hypothetical protein